MPVANDIIVSPSISLPNQCSQRSGAPVGPGGGTAKSPGRRKVARSRPGNFRTAVIAKDGWSYNVRQNGIGDSATVRDAEDC